MVKRVVIDKQEDLKEFEKKQDELKKALESKRAKFARENFDKAKPIIRKNGMLLYEISASYCVIVILFDKRNFKGTMVHVENPTLALGALQQIISKMYVTGSENIMAVLVGGSEDGGKKWAKRANCNWEECTKVLKRNHIYLLDIDMDLKNIQVDKIVLRTNDGLVSGIVSKPGEVNTDTYIEFRMSKF